MEFRFVGSYVEDFKTGGMARLNAAIGTPVLIVRDLGATNDEEEPAFQTKFMSRADMAAAAAGHGSVEGEPTITVGQVIPIKKRQGGAFPDRIGIGRAPNVDVRVPLSQVSKYHAYFSAGPDGTWLLTDAGSRNGTFIRGERLQERVPTPVSDASDVSIGPYRFTFHTLDGFVDVVKRRAGASVPAR